MAANTNANDSDDLEDLDYGDDDFDLESRTDQSQISGTRTSTQEAIDDDDDDEGDEKYDDDEDDEDDDDDDDDDDDNDGQEDETSDNNLLGESYELNAHKLVSFRPRRHKLEETEQPNNNISRNRGLKRKNRDDEDDNDAEGEQNCDQFKNGDKSNVERCKFWPYCTAGDKCSFYHPTKPCRTFPNCRFGSNCLYIHPPCKFLPFCTRSDCPFAHPAKQTSAIRGHHHRALLACAAIATPAAASTTTTTTTAAAAAAATTTNAPILGRPQLVAPIAMASSHFRPQPSLPPVAIQQQQQPAVPKCKFGFKCANLMCKFSHQATEPCRYGANCLLENCAFTHPTDQQSQQQKKSSNVFKWTAKS